MTNCFSWYAILTMESMNRLEELRQTKLIMEKWISTVREQEGKERGEGEERQCEEKQNEWTSENILVILSSTPLPHCEPQSRAASLPLCSGYAGPLGTHPAFCPNYQLLTQWGEKISPSTPVWTSCWTGAKLTERRGWPWIAPALGFATLSSPPSVHTQTLTHTHTAPQTVSLFNFLWVSNTWLLQICQNSIYLTCCKKDKPISSERTGSEHESVQDDFIADRRKLVCVG